MTSAIVRELRCARLASFVLCATCAASIGRSPAQAQSDPAESDVSYYEQRSMLQQANTYATRVDGQSEQWNGQYLDPEPQVLTKNAAEFLTIYPRSYLAGPGSSVMASLADEKLWSALQKVGITLMHPIAFEQAGS